MYFNFQGTLKINDCSLTLKHLEWGSNVSFIFIFSHAWGWNTSLIFEILLVRLELPKAFYKIMS